MTAVVFAPTSVSAGFWFSVWFMAVVVAFIGIGPLLSWLVSAWKRPRIRRVTIACVLAVAISLTLGVKTAHAVSIKCDWYDILFWLCG